MIDYINKPLFKRDSVDKQLIISFDGGTITNKEIYENDFHLSESLCTEDRLVFGSCIASEIRFTVGDIFGSLKGKWLTVDMVLNGDKAHPFRVGKYKVDSDKPDIDRNFRNVIAYDVLSDIINADVTTWYKSLSFPMSLKSFRDRFFTYFGVLQEPITLANDNMVIEKTIDTNRMSGKDVITAICELNGCFGHITRDGNFRYVVLEKISSDGLYPSNDLYPSDNLYPIAVNSEVLDSSIRINCGYEDYVVRGITRVQIRDNENDIGAVYGSEGNDLVIEDNFLVYGKDASTLNGVAANIFSVVKNASYRPFDGEFVGNLCIEVGDAIITTGKYEIVRSYVLNRDLDGVQALTDHYVSNGEEIRQEEVNGTNYEIIKLKGKTNELIRTADYTISRLTDVEKGVSEVTQTATSLSSRISSVAGDVSSVEQTANSLNVQINGSGGLSSRVSQTESEISAQASEVSVIANNLSLKADRTEIQGFVTFSDLSGGNTTIDGACIKTGTIDADRINVKAINISTAQVTSGTFDSARIPNLSASKITTGTLSADRIDVKGIVDKFNSMDLACDELTANSRISTSQLYASYIEGKQPHWEEYGSLKNSDYVLCGY